MKKIIATVLAVVSLLCLSACSFGESVNCQYCDAANDKDNNYCSSCGKKLPVQDNEDVKIDIKEEIALVKGILTTLNRTGFLDAFPDAVSTEEYECLVDGTFSGIKGHYEVNFSNIGNNRGNISSVIFRYEETGFDVEQVVSNVCSYLGDYIEYNSKYDSYEWENEDININISFYPVDGIWFELVDESVIESDNSSISPTDSETEIDAYSLAERYISEGNYEDALNLLATLEQTDAVVKLEKECIYQIALTLESFQDAYDAFSSLGVYKDAEEKAKESYYNEGLRKLDIGFNEDAYLIFYELGDYKDSAEKAKEAVAGEEEDFYEEALELYLGGEIIDAKKYLEGCTDYEDAATLLKYINTIEEYQGVYALSSAYQRKYIVIDGCELITYDLHDGDQSYQDVVISEYGGGLCFVSKYDFEDPQNAIYWRYPEEKDGEKQIRERSLSDSWRDEGDIYYKTDKTKVELDAEIKGVDKPVNPRIGMTAEEVVNSTWGPPIKKNVRTFEWGTTEQWVYFGDRYIYFENGKVVSISE